MDHRRTYQVGRSTLSLQFGDIRSSNAEVLVSSDDYMLSMGGGVSASIAEAAGSALELDVTKAIPRQLGDVVVTTAGALAARYVFHVVTIGPRRDGDQDLQLVDVVERATGRCLALLPMLGVRSIAFPALGTGVARMSTEDAAVGMAAAALSFLGRSDLTYDVQLHLWARERMRDEDYIAFFEVFAARLPSLGSKHLDRSDPEPARSGPRPTTLRVLELERERAHLEHELALAREGGEAGAVSDLGANLQANAEQRAEAYDDSRRERAPLAAFVSYAHEDEAYKDALEEAMAGLRLDGSIVNWTDRRIVPGADWEQDIDQAMEAANVVLLLVSNKFLNSPYCTGVELKRALERGRDGSAVVVPVILSPADWKSVLGHLQALPTDGTPISRAADRDEAFQDVVHGLRRVVASLRTG